MLVTHERHHVKDLLYLLDRGEMLWDMVKLELSQVYFFVNYEVKESGRWMGRQAMLWQPFSFLALCSGIQDSSNQRMVGVSLLIPPHISANKHWEMLTLEEIWLASQNKQKQRFFVYLSNNGKRYAERSISDLSDDALVNIERFYPLPLRNEARKS